MLSDPGSKLDFGTLIAYLIPGYILEILIFMMFDTSSLYFTQEFLLKTVTWDAGRVAILVALLTLLAYLLGLIFDVIAHPITLQTELETKNSAYQKSVLQFQGFVKNKQINEILFANRDSSFTEKRNLFIDSMFYRVATPEIWARQNWHWAFYEFSRQMYLLCIPAIAIIVFYIVTASLFVLSASLGVNKIFWLSLTITTIISVINRLTFKRLLKEANRTDGEVYYRHRAWAVFAYLIEKGILEKAFQGSESPANQVRKR